MWKEKEQVRGPRGRKRDAVRGLAWSTCAVGLPGKGCLWIAGRQEAVGRCYVRKVGPLHEEGEGSL